MGGAGENSRLGHVFRSWPWQRERAVWLDSAVLHWRVGERVTRLPLTEIAVMRLNLPSGEVSAGHCVLVDRAGRVHRFDDRFWPRLGKVQLRRATFRGLTFTLARRLAQVNPEAVILQGPGRGEWLASCLVALAVVAVVVVGAGLMLAEGRFVPAVVAFMGLAAVSLPFLWPVIRSGGPRPLDPATLDLQEVRGSRGRP
jgi:hypothetical protein